MNRSAIDSCIHTKLKQESNNNLIERKKLCIMLGYYYHIPKEERNNVIKELEEKGIIKVVSKFEVEVR